MEDALSSLIPLMSTGVTEDKTGTGDVMYIYYINVMNPKKRAVDVQTFVTEEVAVLIKSRNVNVQNVKCPVQTSKLHRILFQSSEGSCPLTICKLEADLP